MKIKEISERKVAEILREAVVRGIRQGFRFTHAHDSACAGGIIHAATEHNWDMIEANRCWLNAHTNCEMLNNAPYYPSDIKVGNDFISVLNDTRNMRLAEIADLAEQIAREKGQYDAE